MPFALRSLIVVLTVGLGLLQGATAQPSSSETSLPPGAKTRSDTVDLSPDGRVEISNRTGSITVTTWDRDQVGYAVTLAPREGTSVVATDFDIDHSDEELSFGHDHSWSIRIPGLLTISPDGTSEPIGHFRVVMPRTAHLEIDDHESTIEVSGVQGKVNIDTHAGTVTATGLGNDLKLETFSGTATATGIRGGAELETHSGRITAAFETFSAESSAETHSGPLRLFLPSNTGLVLETDADSTLVTVDEAFGSPSRDEERWTYNGGGPDLSIETFSGSVEVRPLGAYPPSSR
jgi:hypothetical protein